MKIIAGYIWWRLWFLLRQRVWRVLRGGWAWLRTEPIGKKEFFSCWIWQVWILQWRFCRRCHGWRSSWCSWLSLRFRCRGGLAWGLCRCRWRRFRLFFFWLSYQQLASWPRLASFPFKIVLKTLWQVDISTRFYLTPAKLKFDWLIKC